MGHGLTKADFHQRLDQSLATSGLRSTRQRHHVYQVLLQKRDHPTAEEVLCRAKQTIPDISFATVYNCLDALVQCGLVRQVNVNRAPTRYCPNMDEHCHFYCGDCGQVTDIPAPSKKTLASFPVPPGFEMAHYNISLWGLCPSCAGKRKGRKR